MATVLTPQRANQSASRCRSDVKVPCAAAPDRGPEQPPPHGSRRLRRWPRRPDARETSPAAGENASHEPWPVPSCSESSKRGWAARKKSISQPGSPYGVTTLKSATDHRPRFFTGSPSKNRRPLPSAADDTSDPFLRPQAERRSSVAKVSISSGELHSRRRQIRLEQTSSCRARPTPPPRARTPQRRSPASPRALNRRRRSGPVRI